MAPHKTPMTRLTSAPTTPTSKEICAPNKQRENKSRPCKSVPNQCCAVGGENCASESSSGLCNCAKRAVDIFRMTGQMMTATSRKIKNQALMTAARFFLKRSHAGLEPEFGLSTVNPELSTL